MALTSQLEDQLGRVTGSISKALVKAQAAMGNAIKDSKNPFFKSSYADLNAIREAIMPALLENGIAVLQPTAQKDGKNYVRTLLLHESGDFIESYTEIVVAKQNDPQAQGSGISYARRYGLQSLLNVGAEDDDGERAMNRNDKKPAPVSKAIPAGVDIKAAATRPEVVAKAQAVIARKLMSLADVRDYLGYNGAGGLGDALQGLSGESLSKIHKHFEGVLNGK